MDQKDDYRLNHATVYFYGGAYDDGCVYIAEIDINLLLRLDIYKGELEIIDSLKNRGINCCGILKMHNKIVVSYSNKSSEMILKTSKNEWIKKEIDYCGSFENDQAFEFKDNVYIFDKSFGIRKYDADFKNIDNFIFPNDTVGIQASRVSETKIVIIMEKNKIMEFDLSDEKVIELKLPYKIDEPETICYDGKNYWVTTHNWEIVKFNIYNNTFQCYPMPGELVKIENQKDKRRFEKSYFYENKVWVIPYYASSIMLISTQDGTAELLKSVEDDYIEGKEKIRRNSMQYISVFCKKGILLLSCATQHIYYLDFVDCKMVRLNLHINWRKKDFTRFCVISEGMLGIDIKQFLNVIM